ncbi:hypothetical protein BIT28_05380 [Photobacterium proteolyticum]|uniref:histidine kinase n=1 Tax=Photobacterium proteolyticum TaxID=1903952 RepID=A0A1Q9GST0_9GAMM|nr:HAMP domain-containing sensor histidine kinase [Photobacterium proteolyticum]OLQ77764.1 hypothetical protein BIT28_05380 [Photobacterium proteolyticum]
MKIRLSLRLYFLAAMLLLGVSLVMVFSGLTASYYFKGMDKAMRLAAIDTAEVEGVRQGLPKLVIGFTVASDWQDVPEDIKEHIPTPPTELYVLEKHIKGSVFSGPPEAGYFVMLVINSRGERRFVSRSFVGAPPDFVIKEDFSHFFRILIFCISGIVTFSVVLILMMRSVASPVEKLRDWAKSLSADSLKQAAPDFRYNELNTLATLIQNSLNLVQEGLEREQVFLRHASHELRTPIAVIRTNTELLKKLGTSNPDKSQAIVERIERASLTMGHLTDTLLWMSRESTSSLPAEYVDLGVLLEELVDELHYLLQGKSVSIEVETSPHSVLLPVIGCRIVLTNLIRNAFQHTQHGRVVITQVENTVLIQNSNSDSQSGETSDLGFGLGLDLTEKLVKRFGWQYEHRKEVTGHVVKVRF